VSVTGVAAGVFTMSATATASVSVVGTAGGVVEAQWGGPGFTLSPVPHGWRTTPTHQGWQTRRVPSGWTSARSGR
jgi:hypothetical protein